MTLKSTPIYLTLVLLCIAFFSCENEPLEGFDTAEPQTTAATTTDNSGTSTTNPSGANSNIFVTKMTTTFEGGLVLTSDFTYNGNNLVETIDSDGYTNKYIYDSNNKLIKIEEYEGSILDFENTITYDSNDELLTITVTSGSSSSVKTYTNNSDGSVTETNSNGDEIIYMFSNENLISITDVSGDDDYSFTFDSFNNPFKNISNKKILSIFSGAPYSINNDTSVVNTNTLADSYDNSETTYTYNSDNYPLTSSSIQTYKASASAPETTETVNTEYFYN